MKSLSIYEDNFCYNNINKTNKITKFQAEQLLGVPLDDLIRFLKRKYSEISITFYENTIVIILKEYPCSPFWLTKIINYPEFIDVVKKLNENYKLYSKEDIFGI